MCGGGGSCSYILRIHTGKYIMRVLTKIGVYWCLRVVEFVPSIRAGVQEFKDLSGCCLAAWTL